MLGLKVWFDFNDLLKGIRRSVEGKLLMVTSFSNYDNAYLLIIGFMKMQDREATKIFQQTLKVFSGKFVSLLIN